MLRYAIIVVLAAIVAVASYIAFNIVRLPAQSSYATSAGPVKVEEVAGPFSHPWAVAFLQGGEMLVTERGGKLWRVSGNVRSEVAGVPAVKAEGQGGLLDVVAARDFAETREIFLTYSEPAEGKSRTAVARARLSADGARLEDFTVIFRQEPAIDSTHHYGSRIVEARDGTLWVTFGERGASEHAQNLTNDLGKVIRINRDGTVPSNNPMIGGIGRPEIWSYGHRNPQGAAIDPETGHLWTVEHGAKGGDEINHPEGGKNYGWPVISYGTTYAGTPIGMGTENEGMEQPAWYWDPSIAPSGMAIYSGKLWPTWKGDFFVGGLKYKIVSHLDRDGDTITGEERLFAHIYGRVRDVREGPDGAIWFLTDEDDGALYRIVPAN